MFKKLKKKRLSWKLKRKSTSLKDINVVGKFVLQTAQIMSASAESLETLHHSNSLLIILEKVFQPSHKASKAPTSIVSSSQRNSIFNRSESTNNSSPKREMSINNNNITDRDQFVCLTTEENSNGVESVATEKKILFEYSRPEKEIPTSYYEDSAEDNDEPSEDIGAITEENGSGSDLATSYYIDPLENSCHTVLALPPQRDIVKHPLKRSFSFSDVDIREIKAFNKTPETIRTFSSTESTLSVEIISPHYSGTIDSILNLHIKHILTTRERYLKKAAIKYSIKTALCRDKSKSSYKVKFKTLISDKNERDKSNTSYKVKFKTLISDKNERDSNRFIGSMQLNIIENVKMLSYAILKDYYHSFFKLNVVSDEVYHPIYATSTLEDIGDNEALHSGDRSEWSVSNNNGMEGAKLQIRTSYHGDERSEISEVQTVEDKETRDAPENEVRPVEDKETHDVRENETPPSRLPQDETTRRSLVSKIFNSRTIVTSLLVGGVLLLTPAGQSVFRWLSMSSDESAGLGELPILQLDISPQSEVPPIYYISNSLFADKNMAGVVSSYHRV